MTTPLVRRFALLPLLAAALLWTSVAGAAVTTGSERRVALVIGNSAYRSAPVLPNPVRDAEAMAASLQRLGFEVTKGEDLDRAELVEVIREFAAKLPGADVAMVFYAGHGLQVDGHNYLIPVDAELSQELDLDFEATSLDLVLRQMEREQRVNLVFLDACRDNPLAQNLARSMGTSRSTAVGRGLALVDSSVGSFIAYATQPGNVALDGAGDHSPFTAALLKHIETPGLGLSDMMAEVRSDVIAATGGKQVPWDHSSLTGGFYFQPASLAVASETTAAAQPAAQSTVPAVDKEVVFWESIKSSANPADFQAYLSQFPNGTFASLAQLRVTELQAKPAAPTLAAADDTRTAALTPDDDTAAKAAERVEQGLGLNRVGRSRVQLALTLLGYKTGGTDGRFGGKTRTAIAAWQKDAGEDATGYLTAKQHAKLLDAAAPQLAAYDAEQKKKAQMAAAAKAKADAAAQAEADRKWQQQEEADYAAAAEEVKRTEAAKQKTAAAPAKTEAAQDDGPDVNVGVGIGIGGGGVGLFPSINFGY